MTIKIVTDSVSDLPTHVAQELGITIVPLYVNFSSETYRDGIDLSTDEFFKRLESCKSPPTTSVPSPEDFARVYDKLAKEADEILVITLSSKLSGTYEVARQSVELIKQKCRIEVIDSQKAIMAEGLLVISAAKAVQAGASIDDTVNILKRNIPRTDMVAAFDTLEYLRRGGRIGKAQAFLGSALKINPIIGLRAGEVSPVSKTRSRAKALDYLYNYSMNYTHIEEMAIEYATNLEEAETLAKQLSVKFPLEQLYFSRISPVIGTNTGPSIITLSVLGDKD